ncbi:PorP/SprF family type IX secretion system membrane protein [Desertivirga arenae]|uniref:PorP/SprF family type IX secretion system membrane protein n=1 Tax=Desertivirga arenae TaxID=2810309 RepID=UPI001A976082|nr:PorP/SprF family type IX secretion system membrane protein [Pedobacter sp. SYSU D00823]
MKNTLVSLLASALCFLAFQSSLAQQLTTYNQYSSNLSPLNSAASLINPDGQVSLVSRQQWSGIEGAPVSFWGNAYLPYRSLKATLGVNFRYDKVGEEQNTDVSVFVAKSVQLSENSYFALSVNAGLNSFSSNYSNLEPGDPVFANGNKVSKGIVGAGILLYNPSKFYVGVSMPKYVLSNQDQNSYSYSLRNQFLVNGGLILKIADDFKLRPSGLIALSQDSEVQAEASGMAFIKDLMGLGLNVRSYGGLAGIAQLDLKSFRLGYSYQFNSSKYGLGQINNNTQEFLLSYRFGKGEKSLF